MNNRTTFFFALTLLIAGIVSATVYTVISLRGDLPMSWPIFFGWLMLMNALNGFLLLFLRRHWSELGLVGKTSTILWGSVATWYWSFAILYFFFVMNVDREQLKWTALAYFWEVPLVGGLFIFIALRLLRPIKKLIEENDAVQNPSLIYTLTFRYPLYIALLIFFFSTFGYFIGAVQIGLAFSPPVEQVKNIFNGMAVALSFGVLLYLLVDVLMDDARLKIKKAFVLNEVPKRRTFQKIFVVTALLITSAVGMLSLVVFKSFQDINKEHKIAEAQLNMEVALRPSSTDASQGLERLEADLQEGGKAHVYLLDSGESLPESDFSQESRTFVLQHESGSIDDLKRSAKVVVFSTGATTGKKIVLVLQLEAFTPSFIKTAATFVLAAVFVLMVLLGIVALLSAVLSRSIEQLTVAVRKAEQGEAFTFALGSADEIDELSRAFAHFIGQAQELQKGLEEKVAEQTRQLSEKVRKLEELNNVMTERELKMIELKEKIAQLEKKQNPV